MRVDRWAAAVARRSSSGVLWRNDRRTSVVVRSPHLTSTGATVWNCGGISTGPHHALAGDLVQTAGRWGAPDAIQSTTRSPIMITVAWVPPDRGMRGITDASTTHNPWTPLTRQY